MGITVHAVITDKRRELRSKTFATAVGPLARHIFTGPYRPQTGGKVERFHRTLMAEWAHAHPYTSKAKRAATYQDWIHF